MIAIDLARPGAAINAPRTSNLERRRPYFASGEGAHLSAQTDQSFQGPD